MTEKAMQPTLCNEEHFKKSSTKQQSSTYGKLLFCLMENFSACRLVICKLSA
ncbi:hypothetical protein ACTHQ8_09865 [Lysinibacillus odysseyi]|uniref:hypothetical protein n=1 Tax=Lysinibacillus odysseyi TaxID=202611 RepID=UPI00147005DD|nr:hypothetical protein [Lysinibacillus odysseyi]